MQPVRKPALTCSAEIAGYYGPRRCRVTVREPGGLCHRHGGVTPPRDPCPTCRTVTWEAHDGSFRCGLCEARRRATDAERVVADVLQYAETVAPGRGSADDIVHFIRTRTQG